MWLLSYTWARSLMHGLKIERNVRFGWMQVGDRLQERIAIDNGGWAPGLWVQVNDHSDMKDYEISSVKDVWSWKHRNWYTQGVCGQRGLYTLGAVTLETEDPFGLYKVTVDYRDSVNMMVVPQVVPLPEIEVASGGRVGEGFSSNKGLRQTIESVGVRQYIAGDSLRWLHWPTTARKGEPYVHKFENEPSSDWWIVLDMDETVQAGKGHRSTEEHGVILAASLVNKGLQLGKHVGLVAQGSELLWHTPGVGDGHLWSILRSLAKIRPGKTSLSHLLERIRLSLGPRTSLIVITSNLSPEWINALNLLMRSGIVPTVLLLDPQSFGGEQSAEVSRKRLLRLGVTHYIISADLLDEPKKSAKEELKWLMNKARWPYQPLDVWQNRGQKIVEFLRTWGLIFLFYWGMAQALGHSVRGLEPSFIWMVVAAGVLAGSILARLRLPGWLAAGLGLIAGWIAVPMRVGRLGSVALDGLARLPGIYSQAWVWLFHDGEFPSLASLWLTLSQIWSGISAITARVWNWFSDFLGGRPFYDPTVNAFLWGVAIWGVVCWSMWGMLRRKKPLWGFLPAIILVVTGLALTGQSSYNLTLMLGSASALMVFVSHDSRQRSWETSRLNYTSSIRSNIAIAAIVLALGLMAVSVVTPAISIDRIARIFQRIAGETGSDQSFVRAIGLQSQNVPGNIDVLEARRSGGLPNRHLINSSSKLSDEVVMAVRIESGAGQAEDLDPASLAPLYLRSLIYDRYTGRGWVSRETELRDYEPGDRLPASGLPGAQSVRQQVQYVEDLDGIVYTVGSPLSFDQDFRAAWRIQDDEAGIYDLFGVTVAADTYRADSWITTYGEEELRSSGQVYPDWVVERYMSLPSTVPESVLTLARDLTATEPTPYDQVVAIERYLRKIPYTLNVNTGPPDQDITEYFLFDLQKGYCDFYATAMVVLARSAGFPARYVAGYIGENYDPENDVYLITADEAHAWAEVYFPGYGWIPFEPTGGRPAIERSPERFPELPENFELNLPPLVPESGFSWMGWKSILGMSFLLTVGLILVSWLASDWILARRPVDSLLPALFRRIFRYARRSGLQIQPGDTANQVAGMLNGHLRLVGGESHWAGWMLQGPALVSDLTGSFVTLLFDPSLENLPPSRAVMKTYRRLRPRLWLLWLLVKVYPLSLLRPFFWGNAPLAITIPIKDEP